MSYFRKYVDADFEEKEDREEILLTKRERTFILKKLFNIPVHMEVYEQIEITIDLAERLGDDRIIGDVLTIFRRKVNGE